MDFEKLDSLCNEAARVMNKMSLLELDKVHNFIAEYVRQRQEDLDKTAADAVARVSNLEDRMDIVEKYCHSHVAGIECGYAPASFMCARDGDREPRPATCESAFSQALTIMQETFRDDLSAAHAWHDNVAVCALDEKVPHDMANKIASRFMRAAFCVNTVSPTVRHPTKVSDAAEAPKPRSYSEWEAQQRIPAGARAYYSKSGLCTVNRQDDDEPITEEWLLSLGFITYSRSNGDGYGLLHPKASIAIWQVSDKSVWKSDVFNIQVATRRDLRLLCELLKIELEKSSQANADLRKTIE